jgi:hypothetical protein
MNDPTSKRYTIVNADGVAVAAYDDYGHAIESARENAMAAAMADPSNFFSVHLTATFEELCAFRAKDYIA